MKCSTKCGETAKEAATRLWGNWIVASEEAKEKIDADPTKVAEAVDDVNAAMDKYQAGLDFLEIVATLAGYRYQSDIDADKTPIQ